MNKNLLQTSINKFKSELFNSIKTSTYNDKKYENGQKAKEALIRSQKLILNLHESVKKSFYQILKSKTDFNWSVHPEINQATPELKIYGKIKGKNQDIVFLRTPRSTNYFNDGPNIDQEDKVGIEATKRSIIISVRSQMSSVDKNFDTLMERAFAETLNLRLRAPTITMGEVYLLPIEELDDQLMLENQIKFSGKKLKVEKFIRTFNSFSGRSNLDSEDLYKYDASALILIDLKENPPKIIFNKSDLEQYNFTDEIYCMFERISAEGFDERLLKSYNAFQKKAGL